LDLKVDLVNHQIERELLLIRKQLRMLSASTTKVELFRKTKLPTINLETKVDQHSLEETKEEALISKEHS
jgi:hypothetical protein